MRAGVFIQICKYSPHIHKEKHFWEDLGGICGFCYRKVFVCGGSFVTEIVIGAWRIPKLDYAGYGGMNLYFRIIFYFKYIQECSTFSIVKRESNLLDIFTWIFVLLLVQIKRFMSIILII